MITNGECAKKDIGHAKDMLGTNKIVQNHAMRVDQLLYYIIFLIVQIQYQINKTSIFDINIFHIICIRYSQRPHDSLHPYFSKYDINHSNVQNDFP